MGQYTQTPTGVFEPDIATGAFEGELFCGFSAESKWDVSARPLRLDWWNGCYFAQGVQLGNSGTPSLEVVLGIVAGPGGGKTSLLAEIAALWPGNALIVSSKPDIAKLTAPRRSRLGRVRYLNWSDPTPPLKNMEEARWSLLDGATDPAVVTARVASMLESVELGGAQRDKPIWRHGGATILSAYLHSAALEGLEVEKVLDWTMREETGQPARIIERKGSKARFGRDLEALKSAAAETSAGFWATARPTVVALSDPAVLASMSNPNLDAAEFLSEPGTLYVVDPSGESETSPCAPLSVALLNRITSEARRIAYATPAHPHHPAGRLCPPLLVILDEVANTSPTSLSRIASQSREVGPLIWSAQSFNQLALRWQDSGAKAIWDHTNFRMLGSGISDPKFLGDVSEMLGSTKEWVPSLSSQGEMSHSQQVRPVVEVDELGKIPKLSALLIANGEHTWVRTPAFAAIEPFKTWASDPVLTAEQRAAWERETGYALSMEEIHARVEAVMETSGTVVGEGIAPVEGSATVKGTVNPFPWGQCTWWAYHKDPVPGVSGDAWQWADTAQRKVVRIAPESLPPVGGLAVYRSGLPYGPPGHVAVIEAIHRSSDGGVIGYRVTEANMRPGVIVTRDIPFPDPNVIAFLPPPGEWYSYKPILAPLPVVEVAEPAEAEAVTSGR
jgi:surface antigen